MDYEYHEERDKLFFIWLAEEDQFYDFRTVWESYFVEQFDMRIFLN